MKLSHILFSSFLVLFLSACGYKPSSHYAKEQVQGNVFVNLEVDLEDPQNAVLIKDAMNEIIVHRLDSKIVYDRKLADTVMDVKLNSVSVSVLQDDAQGFNKLFNVAVNVRVKYTTGTKSETFSVSGDTDYSVANADDSSTLDSNERFVAVRQAASKALEEVISRIAVNSFKKEEK